MWTRVSDENRGLNRWLRVRGRSARPLSSRTNNTIVTSRVYSTATEDGTLAVMSVVGLITELPSSTTTTTESSTQTPKPMPTCSAEMRMISNYIDNLVTMEETSGETVPTEFLCPITHQAMRNPYAASDGFTYEFAAIKRWMRQSDESPMNRETLREGVLVRNRALEQVMIRWARDHAKQSLNRGIHSLLTRV